MYDFIDRPVTDLDNGGRFIVWAARSWVKAVGERRCPAHGIAPAFAKWNMLSGLQPFLGMMALFNRHGLQNFEFCGLQCNHVSEHEAIIVSLLCGLQEDDPVSVRQTLELLVSDDAIGDLLLALNMLDKAMYAAGIRPGRETADTPPVDTAAKKPRP
ncbi:hypothetical protein IDJ81_14460 [Tsuneonella flava]|uniref:Uncharacterized protein n=1 Tax=Tsuneonella flava TaxID=2055955 RepID=A0ABX7K888_9SPHN|nr:hypothetical protein [Tsuneonella flava]QSB44480.1 hypothetical protein IDJ81_14460 [Tsuneonella flava]